MTITLVGYTAVYTALGLVELGLMLGLHGQLPESRVSTSALVSRRRSWPLTTSTGASSVPITHEAKELAAVDQAVTIARGRVVGVGPGARSAALPPNSGRYLPDLVAPRGQLASARRRRSAAGSMAAVSTSR